MPATGTKSGKSRDENINLRAIDRVEILARR